MKKKKSFISMKISRSCVTISHLYPRFDFFQTWYFVIKNTHQLRDPSKRSKVKILYLSRLATLNFSWSTIHLWWSLTIHRIVIDAPKTIKSTFSILSILFFSRPSFSHESSSPFRTFSNQFFASPFSSPSTRIVFYLRQNCISQLVYSRRIPRRRI